MILTAILIICPIVGFAFGWYVASAYYREIGDMSNTPAQLINPNFIKPSMTVEQAAREAAMRNYILKSSWHATLGLRIVAVPRQQ